MNTISEQAPVPSNPVTPLADSQEFSPPSPDGSGNVTVSVSGRGDTCSFEKGNMQTGEAAGAPANLHLPHGVLDFFQSGCDAYEVQRSLNFPSALPAGVAYYKEEAVECGYHFRDAKRALVERLPHERWPMSRLVMTMAL